MRRRLAVLLLLIPFVGCSGVTIKRGSRGFLPVIPKLERPTLVEMEEKDQEEAQKVPELVEKINMNTRRIHGYAMKLEDAVKRYNAYAKQNNELVRKELGLPSVKPERPQARESGKPEKPQAREPEKPEGIKGEGEKKRGGGEWIGW